MLFAFLAAFRDSPAFRQPPAAATAACCFFATAMQAFASADSRHYDDYADIIISIEAVRYFRATPLRACLLPVLPCCFRQHISRFAFVTPCDSHTMAIYFLCLFDISPLLQPSFSFQVGLHEHATVSTEIAIFYIYITGCIFIFLAS